MNDDGDYHNDERGQCVERRTEANFGLHFLKMMDKNLIIAPIYQLEKGESTYLCTTKS